MDKVKEFERSGPMRLLTPSLRIATIYDLPMNWLRERDVHAVITDLDNTLVPWRDYTMAEELSGWFKDLHKEGFRTVILTNARPSPTIRKMASKLETELVIGARKPVQRFFREALSKVDANAAETCVVGDQVFTDVLGGNLLGCHTVLVDRIGSREFIGTKFMRVFERMILRRLARRGAAPEAGDRH